MRRMYSESELREFIRSHKDDVVSALVGKDISVGNITAQGEGKGKIIANTVEQTKANYSQTLEILGSGSLTIENIYNRLEIINGILHLVVNIKVKNETENPISTYALTYNGIDLPTDVAEKIYDIEGKKVSEANADKFIFGVPCFRGGTNLSVFGSIPSQNLFFGASNSSALNRMLLSIVSGSQITINAGDYFLVSARVALTLI